MGFFYKLKPVTDNINKKENAVKGFTAMAVSIGTVDLPKLAEYLSDKTTFSKQEAKGVLELAVEGIEYYLGLGHNVSLGDLGTFSVSAESKVVQDKSEIRGTAVKMKRVVHRPSKGMTQRLKDVPFERVEWTRRPRSRKQAIAGNKKK